MRAQLITKAEEVTLILLKGQKIVWLTLQKTPQKPTVTERARASRRPRLSIIVSSNPFKNSGKRKRPRVPVLRGRWFRLNGMIQIQKSLVGVVIDLGNWVSVSYIKK